jgi:hypothetical protein
LSETLNSHPDILCHGEPFHPTPHSHLKGDMRGLDLAAAVALRDTDPQAYVTWFYDHPEVKSVGFKIWHNQAPAIADQLMADTSVAKIIYERTNVLARFSSSRLVKETGIYNLKPGGKRSDKLDSLIDFNAKTFAAYLKQHNDMFAHYRANTKGPVLHSTYDEIKAGGFSTVLNFLGMADMPLVPQKEKLHGSSIIDRFDPKHHDLIHTTLQGIGHPEWVTE